MHEGELFSIVVYYCIETATLNWREIIKNEYSKNNMFMK